MNIKKRIEALESKTSVFEQPMSSEQITRYERAKARSATLMLGQPGFDIATVARMTEPTRRRIEELRREIGV